MDIVTVMLFLHVVGVAGMGIYAVLPFLAGKFPKLSAEAQEGLARGLITGGRIGQYALIIQLLTGGYLISGMGADYSVSWIVAVLVIFVAMAALAGIIQKPLKRIASKEGQGTGAAIKKAQTLSTVIFILFIVILWLMQNPW